eukprot:3622851-Pyramimonas_sp.AAC.1
MPPLPPSSLLQTSSGLWASLGRVRSSFGEGHRGASLIAWRESPRARPNKNTGSGRPSHGEDVLQS